jgi:hypothetical protein
MPELNITNMLQLIQVLYKSIKFYLISLSVTFVLLCLTNFFFFANHLNTRVSFTLFLN